MKTGFFRQVRELKLHMKIPGSALPIQSQFHYVWNWKRDSSESFVLVENQRFFIKVKNCPTLVSIIVKPGYTQKRDSERNPWTLVQDPFGCTSALSALENHSWSKFSLPFLLLTRFFYYSSDGKILLLAWGFEVAEMPPGQGHYQNIKGTTQSRWQQRWCPHSWYTSFKGHRYPRNSLFHVERFKAI